MELPTKITNEYLESLPKIQINPTGDLTCYARYDKDNNVVFMLDNEGNFTGKVAPADTLVRFEAEAPEQQPQEEVPKMPEAIDDTEPTEEDNHRGEKKNHFFVPVLIGIAVVVVIVIAIILGKASRIVNDQQKETEQSTEQISTEGSAATTDPTITTERTEENVMVHVLTTSQDFLPGHVLQKEDFIINEVEEIEYRILAGITGIYTDVDAEQLIGQTVTKYLPSGSYLTYDDIAESYSPVNPWSRTEDKQALLTLAVTVTSDNWKQYLWGVEAKVKVETQTKIKTESTEDSTALESELPEGIKYSNSVVESMLQSTYEIQSAVVVDVLDVNGNSLFATYSSLTNIPSGYMDKKLAELYATIEAVDTLRPCSVVLALPAEEAAVITSLKVDTMNVSLLEPIPEISTDLQSETYTRMQNLGTKMAALWNTLSSEN